MLIGMSLQDDLSTLEGNIEKLKFQYDQYFLGFERRPPDQLRREVERAVRGWIGKHVPNTGIKFRSQTLIQRFTTYRTMWDKILQQIEDGTYKRDLYKANLKAKSQQAPRRPGAAVEDIIEDAEIIDDSPKSKYGSVFDAYVKARQQTKENVSGLTYEKLHDVLEKQAQQLRSKYNAKDVDFRVVIEDGKARLKATPKK
jgi:hypothetical protein